MAKKAGMAEELPFSLYAVHGSEENPHAETTFIRCSNDRMFAVDEQGYSTCGELLLAEWQGSKLKALSQATLNGDTVKVVRTIKGDGATRSVPLTQVEDLR